jgi:hypothetical protein
MPPLGIPSITAEHTGGLAARPTEDEAKVIAFFDAALARSSVR